MQSALVASWFQIIFSHASTVIIGDENKGGIEKITE
jgi:hypothetical protein